MACLRGTVDTGLQRQSPLVAGLSGFRPHPPGSRPAAAPGTPHRGPPPFVGVCPSCRPLLEIKHARCTSGSVDVVLTDPRTRPHPQSLARGGLSTGHASRRAAAMSETVGAWIEIEPAARGRSRRGRSHSSSATTPRRRRDARLCAAAALVADVVAEPTRAGSLWARASCVLVDDERVADVAALRARRRDDVVVVARRAPADEVGGARCRSALPTSSCSPTAPAGSPTGWPRRPLRGGAGASVVGVVGAGGGAGASTVAAGLAAANARRGRQSLLVDADPLGGGIDLLMGCEGVPGLRWPESRSTVDEWLPDHCSPHCRPSAA